MSLSLTVLNPAAGASSKAKGAKVDLPAEVFDVPANVSLIHQVVVAQLAAARQGSGSTKSRGEVRGGGRKPYRQKGTGRARQGSTRAPQFVGGGVVHGPQPRSYDQRTPKKMKAAALRGALSDRARNDRLFVVSALVTGDTPSTKDAAATLAKVSTARHVLVVAERSDELTWKSVRNLPTVHLLEPGQLNTYDVLISDEIVFTKGALDEFLAGPRTGKSATASATSSEAGAAIEIEIEDEAPVALTKPAEKAPAKKATKAAEPAVEAPEAEAPAVEDAAAASVDTEAVSVDAEAVSVDAEAAPAEAPAATKAPAKKAAATKAEPTKAEPTKAEPAKAAAKKAPAKKAAPKKAAAEQSDEETD